MLRACSAIFLLWAAGALASQTYVPPPPPELPAMLSKERVALGEGLFLRNVYVADRIEVHNYLGKSSCGACHDEPTPLKARSLAKTYKDLPATINTEISQRMGGVPLPLEDPAMDALVQYLVHRYRLFDHKLSK